MKSSKKIKSLVLMTVLCAVTLLCPLQPTLAYDDEQPESETEQEYSWDKWLYYDRDDHICVCGYTGVDAKITVPSEINGKPVTEISARKTGTLYDDVHYSFFEDSDYSFFENYNENTAEVEVPEGVIFIGSYTFSGQTTIEEVALPKSLKVIGYKAFAYCEGLTSVTIPENVTEIGSYAFARSGITEIFLPEGLRFIGECAFMSTPMTQIYIPNTVTCIGSKAFSSSKLEEIILPSSLTKLETGLLSGCIGLKKVCISEGTVFLESKVFEICTNLEEVYFPSTLREVDTVFQFNRNLKNIYFAADEEECKLLLGNDIMNRLTITNLNSSYAAEEYYGSVKITYNTPVPLAEPVPYPKEPLKLDIWTIILMAAASICLIMTVIFSVLFIRERKQRLALKAEEKKKAEEGFHPEVLGTWECKKCGTLNSPIGNNCYKCGRKR